MTVETSTCHNCGEKGHYARSCKGRKESNSNSKSIGANDKQKNKEISKVKTGSKDETADQKLGSAHKTTSHDDAQCYTHGVPRPSENDTDDIYDQPLYSEGAYLPPTTRSRPSTLMTTSTWDLRFRGW